MKLLAIVPLAVIAAEIVVATAVPERHHRIARRVNRKKRCVARDQNPGTNNNNNVNNVNNNPPASSSPVANDPPAPAPTPTNPSPPAPAPNNQHQQGTIGDVPSQCGGSGATPDPQQTTGPNGSIFFLDCGIDGAGWNPPGITLDNVITKDLGAVLAQPGNPFSACGQFIDIFYRVGGQYGISPIILASIAMQESSCRQDVTGPNGEQGLMQITVDKCPGGYGSDACKEPNYNIDAGASFLKRTLDSVGGNLPRALGQYNGWRQGMTYADATRARDQGACFAQNNLDYIHTMLNGWCQGVNPGSLGMGFYFNLNGC